MQKPTEKPLKILTQFVDLMTTNQGEFTALRPWIKFGLRRVSSLIPLLARRSWQDLQLQLPPLSGRGLLILQTAKFTCTYIYFGSTTFSAHVHKMITFMITTDYVIRVPPITESVNSAHQCTESSSRVQPRRLDKHTADSIEPDQTYETF